MICGVVNPYLGRAVTDPNFSSVKLLIGADISVVDESSVGRTLTAVGNAARTTSVSKFGAGSLAFDGAGDYYTAPDSADWDLGSGACTMEGFFRFLVKQTNQSFFGQWDGITNAWFFYLSGSTLRFRIKGSGGTFDCDSTSSFTPTLGQWYHIAYDRTPATSRLYVDGAMVGKSTNQNGPVDNITMVLTIGALGNANAFPTLDFNGNMDELRFTKGVARYGSDSGFTVPTAAYPRS